MVVKCNLELWPVLSWDERDELIMQRSLSGRMKYTEDDLRICRELIEAGASYREVWDRVPFLEINDARCFCVKRKLYTKNKLRHPLHVTKEVHRAVCDLLASGKTYKEIVERTKAFRNVDHIRKFARRHGYCQLRPAWRLHQQGVIRRAWEMVRAGHASTAIGKELGISRNAVCGLVWGYGLRQIKLSPEIFVRTRGAYKSDPAPRSPRQIPASVGTSW